MPPKRCWASNECAGDDGRPDPRSFCETCAVVPGSIYYDEYGRARMGLGPCDPSGRKRRVPDGQATQATPRPLQRRPSSAPTPQSDDEGHVLYSADSIAPGDDSAANYPVEFLNSLNLSGLPLHEIKLKVGAVVMLLRNLDARSSL